MSTQRLMSPSTVIPAILGYGDMTPEEAWRYIRGELPPRPDNEFTKMGRYLEPAILAWWRDENNANLVTDKAELELCLPDYYIRGYADAIALHEDGSYSLIEVKTTRADISEEVPIRWYIQGMVYAYMAYKLRGTPPRSVIYVMMRWRSVPYPEEYPVNITEQELAVGEYLCTLAKEFYERYVLGDRPPVDWNVWEAQAGLKALRNEIDKIVPVDTSEASEGEIVVHADYSIEALLQEAKSLHEQMKVLREIEKSYNKLKETIESAYVVSPDFVGKIIIRGRNVQARITYYVKKKLDKSKVPDDAYVETIERRFDVTG